MKSRQKLRDRYAVQQQDTLYDIQRSALLVALGRLRQWAGAAPSRAQLRRDRAKLLEWKRILNFRRRVIWRWRQFRQGEGRTQDRLRKAVLHMLQSTLARALLAWRHTCAEQRALMYRMQGAVRRMLNRKLSMGFEKWQVEAAELKAEQAKVRVVVMLSLIHI